MVVLTLSGSKTEGFVEIFAILDASFDKISSLYSDCLPILLFFDENVLSILSHSKFGTLPYLKKNIEQFSKVFRLGLPEVERPSGHRETGATTQRVSGAAEFQCLRISAHFRCFERDPTVERYRA